MIRLVHLALRHWLAVLRSISAPAILPVDFLQQVFDTLELVVHGDRLLDLSAGVRRRMAERQQRRVPFLQNVTAGGVHRQRLPDQQCNRAILRLSLAMIRSATAGPTPGKVLSNFTSCSSIAVAMSCTGRTIAPRAFFTPTPST